MYRLYAIAAALGVLLAGNAVAQQQPRQPQQRPQIIIQDRWMRGPPPPPSSDRNFYSPAPGVQQPMERVPLPAPLAQPPTNR